MFMNNFSLLQSRSSHEILRDVKAVEHGKTVLLPALQPAGAASGPAAQRIVKQLLRTPAMWITFIQIAQDTVLAGRVSVLQRSVTGIANLYVR